MSKYIDLNEATDLFKGIDATMTGGWVADTLEALPTIEVSEDCISREWVLQMLTTYEKDRSSANELDEWQNRVVEWIEMDIKDAPSVVPKQSELTEAYIRGYKDGAERNLETKLKALQEAVETFT